MKKILNVMLIFIHFILLSVHSATHRTLRKLPPYIQNILIGPTCKWVSVRIINISHEVTRYDILFKT